jgi:hypothetical protein
MPVAESEIYCDKNDGLRSPLFAEMNDDISGPRLLTLLPARETTTKDMEKGPKARSCVIPVPSLALPMET